MDLINPSPQPDDSAAVPFESIPQLASNERFQIVMEQLRELKQFKDRYFEERVDPAGGSGKLPSLWDELKAEAAALAAVAGAKSVTYIDAVLTSVDGTITKGPLPGANLVRVAARSIDPAMERPFDDPSLEQLKLFRAIALAAKDCDPKALVLHGFPAHLIEPAREPGKPRAGSVQFSWVGAKGKGGRRRAAGSGGAVQ